MHAAALAALDRIAAALLHADSRGEPPGAAALTFLLRRYVHTGRAELRAPIEQGLPRGLDALAAERDPVRRCEWMETLVEAGRMSDDREIGEAVRAGLPALVDDLEQLVRMRYEPGEGLAGADLLGQVSCGAALLAVFAVTGRLPYAMLAEELLQVARRDRQSAAGAFSADAVANCRAARLCCQVAQLHADPEYVALTVPARDADYRADAERALAAVAPEVADDPASAPHYGLALLDWLALAGELQ